MRTMKLKTTETSDGVMTVQNPAAPLGLSSDGALTYAVHNIPEGTPFSEVVRLANASIWPYGVWEVDYQELGEGKFLERKVR